MKSYFIILDYHKTAPFENYKLFFPITFFFFGNFLSKRKVRKRMLFFYCHNSRRGGGRKLCGEYGINFTNCLLLHEL